MQQQHDQKKAEKKPLEMTVIKEEVEVKKKKVKQAKVDAKLPALKKEKKIPAVKVMKKVKKEVFLTAKEEVAPMTKNKKKEEVEVAMEQDNVPTAAKFDEAMMEEYDEDAVGDEFLEELTEKKVATIPPKNINKQLVENQATNNQAIKSNLTNKQKDESKQVDTEQRNKQLWGTEEDGGWYASSAKIIAR